MPTTLEDHERRISVLEKATKTEEHILDAVSKIVAESTARTEKHIAEAEKRLTAVVGMRLTEAERRLGDVVSNAARLMAESVNAKFDEVMEKLAAPKDGK